MMEFLTHPFWFWAFVALCYLPWIGMAGIILYGLGCLILIPFRILFDR